MKKKIFNCLIILFCTTGFFLVIDAIISMNQEGEKKNSMLLWLIILNISILICLLELFIAPILSRRMLTKLKIILPEAVLNTKELYLIIPCNGSFKITIKSEGSVTELNSLIFEVCNKSVEKNLRKVYKYNIASNNPNRIINTIQDRVKYLDKYLDF